MDFPDPAQIGDNHPHLHQHPQPCIQVELMGNYCFHSKSGCGSLVHGYSNESVSLVFSVLDKPGLYESPKAKDGVGGFQACRNYKDRDCGQRLDGAGKGESDLGSEEGRTKGREEQKNRR